MNKLIIIVGSLMLAIALVSAVSVYGNNNNFSTLNDKILKEITANEKVNADNADSAPKQTVVGLWTLRDLDSTLIEQNVIIARLLGSIVFMITILISVSYLRLIAASIGRLKCPYCKEYIKKGAAICPFCKTALNNGTNSAYQMEELRKLI